ncbi:hypothetical protein PF008_g17873 [Phytophthora fragariae]|uniref:Uncharacterized protein n=1 Tax=Phytophthora fragariae TaxID=53985 RepID=A0A6G0R7D6_9STRA|nr:hypothetical protein PF008_g17873 [Phytophthora fragariae]
MKSCKSNPPSDLGGADARFVVATALVGLVFAKDTAFLGL